jgi:hypothetical protein
MGFSKNIDHWDTGTGGFLWHGFSVEVENQIQFSLETVT